MAGQERKEAIIRAAVDLFSQRGFRGTTTRELAAAVGVSEPVLYQHFETKRDLYTAIIDHKFQTSEAEFQKLFSDAACANDDRAFFVVLANAIIRWFNEDPAYIRLLLYSALEGHEIATLCNERHAVHVHSHIANYLRGRIEKGAVREDLDPLAVARSFMCTIVQYAQSGVLHFYPKDVPPQKYVETAVDVFIRGIAKPEEK